jgi:DNA-binding transcriptional regulator YdaS (Cro superfamily)
MSAITAPERKRWAEQLGINEQYLYQCLSGRRDMDAAAAMKVERDTGGVLKRQMLCQASFRDIWPDLLPLPDASEREAEQKAA